VTDRGTTAIRRELASAATGSEKALTDLADAADYAERAAGRMLPGYPGIARSIAQIKDAILANHREVTELADVIAPLTHAVDAVTGDSTPGEVITALAPVADELSRLSCATLYIANRKLGDTEVLIRRRLEGGSPEHLQARVKGPRSILQAIHTRLNKAKDATDAVLTAVRAAGQLEQAGSAGGGGRTPPAGEPEPVGPHTEPSYVRRFAEALRIPAGAKAAGIACARDGTPLHDPNKPLTNGRRGGFEDTANATTLSRKRVGARDQPLWYQLDVALTHVEGHVAARMREPDGPHEVVLVVTREPCGGELGCDAMLRSLIPRRATLYVYVAEPGRPARYFRSYTGDGKGVRQ
jgi:nucleic acid/nucleotide deaminase of polymorphic system toxin